MKKLFSTLLLTLVAGWVRAEQTKTIFSPFTGKLDYITQLSTSSIQAGSGVTVSTTSSGVTISATVGGGSTGGSIVASTQGNVGWYSSVATNTISGITESTPTYGLVYGGNGVSPYWFRTILSTETLQSGATIYIDSGTAKTQFIVGGTDGNTDGFKLWSTSSRDETMSYYQSAGPGSTNLINLVFSDSNLGSSSYAGMSVKDTNGRRAITINPAGTPSITVTAKMTISSQTVFSGVGDVTFGSSTTYNATVGISSSIFLSGSIGTNGQVLTSGGEGAIPTWTTPSTSGGSSSLAVATGTTSGFTVPGTSPTVVINYDSSLFKASLQGTATAFVTLDLSSVTALGSSIDLNSAEVTGTLPVGNGGTGLASTSENGIIIGVGAAQFSTLVIPDCSGTGKALTYSPTTGSFQFSCNSNFASLVSTQVWSGGNTYKSGKMTDTEKAISDLSAKVDQLIALFQVAIEQGKTVADLNLISNKVQMAIDSAPLQK